MPFLISSDISTVIEERIRILTNLSQAKSIAAQLQGHSSQIVHYVTDVATSEQIPTRLTSEGTPSAELTVALTLLEAEFEKINEAQAGIKTYESQIQREKEKRRVLLIGTGVAAIIVIVFLANMVLKQREPIPTDQASKPSPTLASQQVASNAEVMVSKSGTAIPTEPGSKVVARRSNPVVTLTQVLTPGTDSTAARQKSTSTHVRSNDPTPTVTTSRTQEVSAVPPTTTPTKSLNLPQIGSGICLPNKCHVQGFNGGLLLSAYGKTFGLFNSGQWFVEDISETEAQAVEHYKCKTKPDLDSRVKWGFNIAYCRFHARGAKLGDPFDEGGSIEGEVFKSVSLGVEVDPKGWYGLSKILIKADGTWQFVK
jgi:hypothetical protein